LRDVPEPEETVREQVDIPIDVSLNCLVLPYWEITENLASALAVLNSVNRETLFVCGYLVFSTKVGNYL
jgi:hypothetical protein